MLHQFNSKQTKKHQVLVLSTAQREKKVVQKTVIENLPGGRSHGTLLKLSNADCTQYLDGNHYLVMCVVMWLTQISANSLGHRRPFVISVRVSSFGWDVKL